MAFRGFFQCLMLGVVTFKSCEYHRMETKLIAKRQVVLEELRKVLGGDQATFQLSLETKYPNWPSSNVTIRAPRNPAGVDIDVGAMSRSTLGARRTSIRVEVMAVFASFSAHGFDRITKRQVIARSSLFFSAETILVLAEKGLDGAGFVVEDTFGSHAIPKYHTMEDIPDSLDFPKEYILDIGEGINDAVTTAAKLAVESILNNSN